MSDSGNRFFEGILTGGIFGFLAGILLAPKSGRELRREIADNSGELYKQAEGSLHELKDKTEQGISSICNKGEEVVKRASTSVQETKNQISHKIEELASKASSHHHNDDLPLA